MIWIQVKRLFRIKLIALFFISFLISCETTEKQTKTETLFNQLSEESGFVFFNRVNNSKEFNIFTYRNFYNGGGVGIGDFNNDGLSDIYMISNLGKNKLFLNQGNLSFIDITEEAGVSGKRAWSTGVSIVDINADGYLDIYVSNAGNVNDDDHKNELFINNGNLTFTEKAADYGLDDDGFTTHASFFDYDGDGDLDVYILNNSFIPVNSLGYSNRRMLRSEDWNLPAEFKGGGDKLMRNDHGNFVDVSEEAGIFGSLIGFGMGVTVGDINQDMLPDIYVSNDYYECDYLYINQGDGTFKEQLRDYIQHLSMSSMGADMADINNDGYPEIFVTDMRPEGDERLKSTSEFQRYDVVNRKQDLDFYNQYMQNALHLNNANQSFTEIAFYSGAAQSDWSWGALLLDMDNDGYRDIYVSNGIYHDLTDMDFVDFFASEIVQEMTQSGERDEVENIINRMPSNPIPNYSLKNNGDLTFTNMSKEWGLDIPSFSNGSAYGDLDNDGDLDLVVNNVNQPSFIFENTTSDTEAKNFISVDLKGEGNNTFGIGAAVYVYYNNLVLKQELYPTRGFQSSVDYHLHFGLGQFNMADSVVVYWPNMKKQNIKSIAANTRLKLDIKDATIPFNSLPKLDIDNTYFEKSNVPFDQHTENLYVDFDYEGLVPKMTSREGPAMVIGDLNGDKLDDVYIGGATGEVAQLWFQTQNGNFRKVLNAEFELDKKYEDTSALLFDADGDGDLDLYVGSGGNDKPTNSELLQDRVYINNGIGSLTRTDNALPVMTYNTSVITPNDYDEDGDIDLFVGNLGVSKVYGIDPNQYLLENNGTGIFTDVTDTKSAELREAGLVSDAVWYDLDKDNSKELILVGQWMAPKVYLFNSENFIEVQTGLNSLTGWWNTVEVADIDKDGDADLVLGNRGENMYFSADQDAPAKVFINDFDNNGTIEQILTRFTEGKDKPIPLKRDLTSQIVSLKKTNLSFAEYAKKSIQEIMPENLLQNSQVKDARYFKSIVAFQKDNMKFRVEALPEVVQFSSVNEILIDDVNGDGYPDLLLGGNDFDYRPQFGRLDAGFFNLLLGGESGFQRVQHTGINGNGMVRGLQAIMIDNEKHILIGINDDKPQLYRYR